MLIELIKKIAKSTSHTDEDSTMNENHMDNDHSLEVNFVQTNDENRKSSSDLEQEIDRFSIFK